MASHRPNESGFSVIFDFDGLLMDTETTNLESWRYEWAAWGLTLNEDDFFVDHGGDMTEQRYHLLAEAVGADFDRDVSHRRRTSFRDDLHANLGLITGMKEWLDEAADEGWNLAVASSSPRAWVWQHLEKVGVAHCFSVMACGDEVGDHKPHPAVYLLALERLAVDPGDAVAIEDTVHGVRAAKAAGLTCIAVPNQFSDPSMFVEADWVVASASSTSLRSLITG